MSHVVTCFLRHRTAMLLAQRSGAVDTDTGRWDGVSGEVEGDPTDAEGDARREVREKTGRTDTTLVRAGDPLDVADGDRNWTVHPFLFEVAERAVEPNDNVAAHEWVSPPVIRERATVPGLWAAYEAVAPTAETVASDETHGSAWLSVRALEALRDGAAVAADEGDESAVTDLARTLRDARPSMAAVANRVNRVLASGARAPAAVRDRAGQAAEDALDADDASATLAAERCGDAVATLSRSGTVLTALREATPTVLVGESRPACEGRDVADSLAREGLDVTLTTDAALASELATRNVDAVLVGADAILADGSVVNKVGTRGLALAAAREGVPVVVVAAAAKVRPDETAHGETGASTAPYDGDAPVGVANPIFDRTPAELVNAVCTERGVLNTAGVEAVAAAHRANAAWDEAE